MNYVTVIIKVLVDIQISPFKDLSTYLSTFYIDMHISMDTLACICETPNCEITEVIELVPDEPASAGDKEHEQIEYVQRCNNIHNRAEEIVLHEMIYS